MQTGDRHAGAAGFAYVLLLVMLAIIGVGSAAAVSLGATMARRSTEQQLLDIGAAYGAALSTYRAATPAGQRSRNPKTLADLLRDPRYPGIKRHLRQVYSDPITGRNDWGIVAAEDGSVAGIYSLAHGVPIQQSGFAGSWESFNDAQSYSAWVFGLDLTLEKAPRAAP